MGPLQDTLLKAEKTIYSKCLSRKALLEVLNYNFKSVETQDYKFTESRAVKESDIARWVQKSYIPALPQLSQQEADNLEKELIAILCAAPLMWNTSCIIVKLQSS